jgi:hypothetical protein
MLTAVAGALAGATVALRVMFKPFTAVAPAVKVAFESRLASVTEAAELVTVERLVFPENWATIE